MYYSDYHNIIINITRIAEKLCYTNFIMDLNKNKIFNFIKIKQLEITFRIPSKSSYEYGFIAMLMLTEKMIDNKVIFLLDTNTLSKKRSIKIGTIITIKHEIMNYFLMINCNHSIPKFYEDNILFSIPYKKHSISYKISKILSNTLFSFDKDINSYYDYLGELEYDFDFLFRTYFNNTIMNKLLLSSKGIHFINDINKSNDIIINEAEEKILLEEFENENKSDEDENFLFINEFELNNNLLNSDTDSDSDYFYDRNDLNDVDYLNDSDEENNYEIFNI